MFQILVCGWSAACVLAEEDRTGLNGASLGILTKKKTKKKFT